MVAKESLMSVGGNELTIFHSFGLSITLVTLGA